MAQTKLFGGYALRRLRRREGLTQAAMAQAIGVSASYLNLLERNQRPLSAAVLLRLSNHFDLDARHFAAQEPGGGLDAMMARLRDPAHADLGLDRTEVEDWLESAPGTAAAFARLHDGATPGRPTAQPHLAARAAVDRWQNHFPDLDDAAERLADDLRLVSGDAGHAITDRLRARHQLAVRVLPVDVLPGELQRLDLHARQLQLSELLDPASRTLALALQLARFECADEVEAVVAGAELTDRLAERHLRRTLFGWAAAAILLPYGRFARACEDTGLDLHRLQRRFGVGFEVLAHRLTAMGRVGARGVPFALIRIDRAGQISQRVAGASGLPAAAFAQLCPLWAGLRAGERAGELVHQTVELTDGTVWRTAARTVWAPASGAGGRSAQFTVALLLAQPLAHALGPSWGATSRRCRSGPAASLARVRAAPSARCPLRWWTATAWRRWGSPERFRLVYRHGVGRPRDASHPAMIRLFKHYLPYAVVLLVLCDVVLLFVSAEVAWIWRLRDLGSRPEPLRTRLPELLVYTLAVELAIISVGVYGPKALASLRFATTRLIVAVSLGILGLSSLFFLVPALSFWRSNLLYAMAVSVLALVLARVALGKTLGGEAFKRRIVVLGAGPRAARIRKLAKRDGAGFAPVGFVAMNDGPQEVAEAVNRTAIASLADHMVLLSASEVVLALEERRNALPLGDLVRIRTTGLHVSDYSSFLERETGRVDLDSLNPSWLIFSDGFSSGRTVSAAGKRLFDIAASALLLVLTAPLIALFALAVKVETRGRLLPATARGAVW